MPETSPRFYRLRTRKEQREGLNQLMFTNLGQQIMGRAMKSIDLTDWSQLNSVLAWSEGRWNTGHDRHTARPPVNLAKGYAQLSIRDPFRTDAGPYRRTSPWMHPEWKTKG